jgi:hypothetical protein
MGNIVDLCGTYVKTIFSSQLHMTTSHGTFRYHASLLPSLDINDIYKVVECNELI